MHAQYVARDLLSPLVTYGDTPAAPVIGDQGKPKETDLSVHPVKYLNLPPGRQLPAHPVPRCGHARKAHGADRPGDPRPGVAAGDHASGMEGAGFAISQVLSYSRSARRTRPPRARGDAQGPDGKDVGADPRPCERESVGVHWRRRRRLGHPGGAVHWLWTVRPRAPDAAQVGGAGQPADRRDGPVALRPRAARRGHIRQG